MSASLTYSYLAPSNGASHAQNYFHFSHYEEFPPPSGHGRTYSYLHPQQTNGTLCPHFHFDLDGIEEEVSILPVRRINQLIVTFTLGIKKEPAICYQGKLISSIQEALINMTLPTQLDQALLNTIATISNYIGQGTKFTYIEDSAKVKGEGVEFEVHSHALYYQATLSSLKNDCKLTYYQKI
ncbi:Conserved hypothetical protein [Candidatus Protochlamydia naegleriophila]|uniref:Uncharacterized protein n=1 Tax=Candidatus Protochlamydia naegleriophila TaxID=389348 RepID=A0A0U5JFQ7_9BACT|nr:hypothetical protein [Candidatus Protochlamydia naegleriophila]CUI17231.1 Conserved hypothetical protein [Candidatus Protochlamydia naegleriophila]